MVIDKKVAGAATATVLSSGMTPTVPGTGQTFTVDDATGYPATGAFVVVVDRGQSNEEKVLVSSRSGLTFTVGSRGYDGTTASTHTSTQSIVEHALDAVAVQLLFDHVDGVEVNPHNGVLLDVADHDIEARHQFGSGLAFGVPVTPTALTPDIAGAAGSGNNPAREDHAHNVPAATATTITGANAEGTAATFARSDHGHALGAGIVTTAVLADAGVTMAKFAGETSVDWSATMVITGVSLGTGGVQYAHYWKFGRLVVMLHGFELGTGGNVTATIQYSLPFTAVDLAGFVGSQAGAGFSAATARNEGPPAARYSGIGTVRKDLQRAQDYVIAGSGTSWGATTPFDWDAGDSMECLTVFESTT
jgi:hypothetical protein